MTRTFPAAGAVALAVAGLLPAVLALAVPALTWVWFAAVLAGLVVLAWTRGVLVAREDLEIRREVDARLHIGVIAPVTVAVRNVGRSRLRLHVRDTPPQALGVGDLGAPLVLAAGAEHRFSYDVRPCDRGAYRFPEVWVRGWSPLRLWLRQMRYPVDTTVSVYPDIRALTDVSPLMIRKLYAELGVKEQRRRGTGMEFDHIKEHTPDDGTHGIDWKATARRCKPMVRTYRVEQNHDVVVGLDTGRLMGSRVGGITKLDHAINAALLLGRVCLVNGDRPGLIAFNDRVQTFLKPAGDRGQMERMLHALHDLDSDFSETSFRRALLTMDKVQRKRSLVILLTDFVHGQADEHLIASVIGLSRRHLVLFVALRDPHLDDLAEAAPAHEGAVFSQVVAQGLDQDRRKVLQLLRSRGVHTLDLQPTQVTQRVINRYLRLRAGI